MGGAMSQTGTEGRVVWFDDSDAMDGAESIA